MPCALTSNFDYPDYLKAILKEIEAGNDDGLKTCACRLKTPLTDEGCPVLDEDGKIGSFPFCWTFTENTSLVGDGTLNPIKLTLKDAMWLYWESKNFNHNVSYFEGGIGDDCGSYSYSFKNAKLNKNNNSTSIEYNNNKKLLVCAHSLNLVYSWTVTCSKQGGGSGQYIYAYFFSGNGNNYYILEGDHYYFYPSFRSSNFGGYAGSTDTDNNFGIDYEIGQVGCGVNSSGPVTQYNAQIKIASSDLITFKNYYCGVFRAPQEGILKLI